MDDRIKKAFGAVHASEELKNRTKKFIAQRSRGYKGRRYALRIIPATAACLALALFAAATLYLTPTTPCAYG